MCVCTHRQREVVAFFRCVLLVHIYGKTLLCWISVCVRAACLPACRRRFIWECAARDHSQSLAAGQLPPPPPPLGAYVGMYVCGLQSWVCFFGSWVIVLRGRVMLRDPGGSIERVHLRFYMLASVKYGHWIGLGWCVLFLGVYSDMQLVTGDNRGHIYMFSPSSIRSGRRKIPPQKNESHAHDGDQQNPQRKSCPRDG